MKNLKNKAAGSYLCLVAAVIALITAIVFLTTQATAAPLGHTGTLPGITLLVGVAASVILFFVPVQFGALIQAGIYCAALYQVVVQLYFVFADVINKVTFAGGNAGLCVAYMVGTFISALLAVIACFMQQTKNSGTKASGKEFGVGVAVAAAAVVAVFAVTNITPAAQANDSSIVVDVQTTEATDGPSMAYADNAFAGDSLEDLIAVPVADWQSKEIAYFFEGQYTEGFSTIVDPAYLDMYCYTDGSMHGSFSGPATSVGSNSISEVYGYWYTVDESGENNFVVHLLGNKDADGTVRPVDVDGGADADIFIFETDHGAYNWEASMSYGVMNGMFTRNINIYGQVYTPAQSLNIDASGLRTFYIGDELNPSELVVTAVRGNGSQESIWGGRLNYIGYDSNTVGTQTVTANFLGATATFYVKVEPLVAENYAGSFELVKNNVPTAMDAVVRVDYSHKVVTVTAADESASITGTLVDSSDAELTMTLNGSEALTVPITEVDGVKTLTIPAHDEVVSGWSSSTTYSIQKAVVTLTE